MGCRYGNFPLVKLPRVQPSFKYAQTESFCNGEVTEMDDNTKLMLFTVLTTFGVIALILAIVLGDPSMSMETVFLVIAGGLAVISAFMLAGRGAWAVAGYNTMSSEEKSHYNPEKIARGCGLILLGVTVFIALLAYGGIYLAIGIAAMAVMAIAGAVYMNRFAQVRSGVWMFGEIYPLSSGMLWHSGGSDHPPCDPV